MRLAERLDKLEQATDDREQVLIVAWAAPGDADAELSTLKCGEQVWHRREDESEQEFKGRAISEVGRSPHGLTILWGER